MHATRTLALATLAGLAATATPAFADPINLLFVGNSFTHGRYQPALGYNAVPANSTDTSKVHDLLCPTAGCTGTVEAGPQVTPTYANTPGATLADKLGYLQNNAGARYNEVGPFSGVAGIFKQFTAEAGLNYNVSIVAVSAATLTGYLNNTGSEAGDLSLIANPKWNQVVLQDQSFQPLPSTVTVNGQSVPTRGKPSSFQSGAAGLVNAIDVADAKAGVANAAITLAETPPLAAYGYTSTNPDAPIVGTSTVAAQQAAGNAAAAAYAPYVGAANPIAQMASDLHNAYTGEANTLNSAKNRVTASLDGDAWVTAINEGFAQQNPYLANEPAGQVDLWDSDPLLACCTVPIGYHPSVYGDYLNALELYASITGFDPRTLAAEFDGSPGSVAAAFGIDPRIAYNLAIAAEDTYLAGGPSSGATTVPEPASLAVLAVGLLGLGLAWRRRAPTTVTA